MKKALLLMMTGAFLCLSLALQGQKNYILNGDFEEQGAWELVTSDGDPADISWEFGTLAQAPLAGDEGCLRVTYTDKGAPLNQILFQRVMLTIGETYHFEGAFKDAGTGADIEQAWHQIIIWPTVEDNDPSDNITGGPHWKDGDASILLNHAVGWGVDHFGVGLNTTYEDDQVEQYGNKVGLGDGEGQGDTTVYTVPPALYRQGDTLVLGEIGDEVEYYVALQVGQWMDDASGIVNTFDFTFDEFKLMGPDDDPVDPVDPPDGEMEDYILNGDFEEQGVWEIAVSAGEESDMTWEFGTLAQAPLAGDEGCLRASYAGKDAPLNQILFQRVMLTVGDTYYFEGAFKDAGTGADVDQIWHQIIIWPTIEDDDPSDNITGGPHWKDGDASILLNHAVGWGVDHFGIGLNTTFEDDQVADYGNKVGLGDGEGQGDTTVYTVPPALYRQSDTLELGAIGDEIEYYVALQVGQWMEAGSGIVNTFDFTFDEFKLMGPKKGTSAVDRKEVISSIEVYPNPVQNLLNVKVANGISSVSIFNVMGQKVMDIQNVMNNHATLDISELSTGMYILSVTDETGKAHSSKVLKK